MTGVPVEFFTQQFAKHTVRCTIVTFVPQAWRQNEFTLCSKANQYLGYKYLSHLSQCYYDKS